MPAVSNGAVTNSISSSLNARTLPSYSRSTPMVSSLRQALGVLQLIVVFDIGNDDWFSGGEDAGYTPTRLRYPAFDGTMAGLKASIKP